MTDQVAVQVFMKYPQPGCVKTRLAEHIGSARAVAVYQELVESVIEELQELPVSQRIELWCDADGASPYIRKLFNWWPRLHYRRQANGDLGTRLDDALRQAALSSSRVVQLGTDCPVLRADNIESALSALTCDSDVVFIPAEDGGYVLGAYRTYREGLFSAIDWSTDRVLQQSITQAQRAGLHVTCLPGLWDIDHLDDLERYRAWQRTQPPGD